MRRGWMCQETARSRFPFIPASGSLNASLRLPSVAIIVRRSIYDWRDCKKRNKICERGPLASHTHIACLPQSHGKANVSIMEEISECDCCLHGNWLRSYNHSNISPRDCWMTTFTFNLSTFELGRGPRVCLCFNEALLSVLRSAANIFYRSGTNGFDKLLPPIRPDDVHCVFGSRVPSTKGRKGTERPERQRNVINLVFTQPVLIRYLRSHQRLPKILWKSLTILINLLHNLWAH